MTHLSENAFPLHINYQVVRDQTHAVELVSDFNDVCMLILPPHSNGDVKRNASNSFESLVATITARLGPDATLVTLGEPVDLVHAHAAMRSINFQLWINIKRRTLKNSGAATRLPEHHFGALVHTKYSGSLRHTTTRIKYTYCPACDKTTKDYGGKKHTYNSYGTLVSDVWRDIECDLEEDISSVIQRFADLFGLENYQELRVLDCRQLWRQSKLHRLAENDSTPYVIQPTLVRLEGNQKIGQGELMLGDCLENLRKLEDNSIDFAFIDPPYNLGKAYNNYADDLSIQEYFSWCDEWIREVTRVLRPGRTLAILNIPLWAIRHFLFMETILEFQNWIAWDALSFPVRKIMPAHYAIVCFSKGTPRPLPGLINESGKFNIADAPEYFLPLQPMDEWYCLRADCVKRRNRVKLTDRGNLTDLWWDIHRLKHNSRRVDHPCQLPPHLMYRLISIFTEPDEIVLDCFNGAGTTTLTAHQLSRGYIGIELSEKYHTIATLRHGELSQGLDPFRKVERKLTEKNSRVARMPKVTYEIPKKTLQLEVRRVAKQLNRLPTREEVIEFGEYPIRYYDEYFVSWGEVCAAARHDGMTEVRHANGQNNPAESTKLQPSLFGPEILDVE